MAIGLDRAFYLLELEPEVVDAENPANMPAPIRYVTYDNVYFCYETGKSILQGVTLEARAGTITAIVGATGSGKSTLTSMLLRLYDPDEGSVAINGVDLKGIRMGDLRGNVAIALQQNVLFASTVAENIGYAAENASREAVEAAAKIACAHDFIEDMEYGYDTELGERGAKLSTGERQRLTIARAILRDTPVLILDEPTAALDAQTEHEVLERLAEWGRERVLFLITHRLSTIRNADQIAFLEDGRIVEVGVHDTLMAIPNGRYRDFVTAETEGADSGGETAP
jgi:ABC-type multidrug transport system fused ATPase/permease subunit